MILDQHDIEEISQPLFSYESTNAHYSLYLCETPGYEQEAFLHGNILFPDPEDEPLEGINVENWLQLFIPEIQHTNGSGNYNPYTDFSDLEYRIQDSIVIIEGSFGSLELYDDGTFRYYRAI
jgi:hypothetical protein